jgi:hypothetical protein
MPTRNPPSTVVEDVDIPRLPNGVDVNDYSVAVARPIASNGDHAEIALAFRRVRDQGRGQDLMRVTVVDDRGNPYSTTLNFNAAVGAQKGPLSIRQLPVGFTWVSRVEVNMPESAIAHITDVAINQGTFANQKQSLDFKDPRLPSLDFKVPDEMLLAPGKKVTLDKNENLVAEFGDLTLDRSRSLSLAISVANQDYNPHKCDAFCVYVQSDDGEVRYCLTIGESQREEIPGQMTRKLGVLPDRTRVVTPPIRPGRNKKPVASDPNTPGLLSGGIHAVLIYHRPNGGFVGSQTQFCGFVPVPDAVRGQSKKGAK